MTVTTMPIDIRELTVACGGRTLASGVFTGVTTDSRNVQPNMLFVAIRGENFDGNDFVISALNAGAKFALCSHAPIGYEERVVVVDDTIAALGKIATWHKQKFSHKTAAITGSVGKTTTKEMIYTVLSETLKTHKTEGNFNNHIGMPMTLLSLDDSYKAAIYEMGMNHAGEISYLSKIARPDIVMITNIGTAHIENLGSREAIRHAKLEILDGLTPGGLVLLNGDEPLLSGVDGAMYIAKNNPNADVLVKNISEGARGSMFDLVINGDIRHSVVVPSFGEHNVMNAAYAYVVGQIFGLLDMDIRNGLMKHKPEGMRQNIYDFHNITIIEDCYNASAESMKAALVTLEGYTKRRGGRSVAVLGEMRELGEFSAILHSSVGEEAAKTGLGLLITVGDAADEIAKAARACGMQDIVTLGSESSADEVANTLHGLIRESDRILFKASRALKFEDIIAKFKESL